ncbi:unnamed protein product [Arabis nemorensis]|uniref:FCP1 homology domain-containing protein n=1 Tax=Arabis nemorensis TaxID=586526 RepID=A0A565B2U5_9BRAS|nr:unnamed protein product [Arabis nemorensis]
MAAATTALFNLKPPLHYNLISMNRVSVSCSLATSALTPPKRKRKLPILLFDVMDTIVRDPFYHDVPAFFRLPMKDLLECKHPMAWIDFEKGFIDEEELARKFFIDGRDFDLEGLKECMRSGYSYLDGMQELLQNLKALNFEIHAFTNYPIWYKMIEDKLKLSEYLSWTFCSCNAGKRKPDPEFYLEVVGHLGVEPCDCIFIDDRPTNVKCAVDIGMGGLRFENADTLIKDLSNLGINLL